MGFTIADKCRLNTERLVYKAPKSFKMACLMILVVLDLMSFKLTWLMEIIHIGADTGYLYDNQWTFRVYFRR